MSFLQKVEAQPSEKSKRIVKVLVEGYVGSGSSGTLESKKLTNKLNSLAEDVYQSKKEAGSSLTYDQIKDAIGNVYSIETEGGPGDMRTSLSELNQAATRVESQLDDIAIQSIGQETSAEDLIKIQIASAQRKIGGNRQLLDDAIKVIVPAA